MNDLEDSATTKPTRKGSRAKAREVPASLTLRYTLGELPSSQHRAGLAGLVIALRYLERQGVEGRAQITRLDESSAEFAFDEAGLKALFDLAYGAATVEVATTTQYRDKAKSLVEPLRIEERVEIDAKTKREKTKKLFIYPQVVPRAAIVHDLDPTRDDAGGLWTKLWRDALWSILRGVPAQRAPFEARAAGEPTTDAEDAYRELATSPDSAVPLPSTFFLGAMDKSAEDVPFRDRARFQFLLHFWPTVASIFVPEVEDRTGQTEFWGYAFAIPDVSALESFCAVWPESMRARGTELAAYRPREAIVSLCREAGLAALARLKSRIGVVHATEPSELVLGYDVIHASKPGNAVKIADVGRVEPKLAMIDEYERIRASLWDYAFRRQRIDNLLRETRWFHGFDRLMRVLPSERVLGGRFGHDARTQFEQITSTTHEGGMGDSKELEQIVLRLVSSYLGGKVGARTKLSWTDAKDDPAKKHEYDEAKEKVARTAFLAIRSRTGADFVDYFAGTLCSVPQRLSNEDYSTLSRALRERPDEVRTLSLLALSARG